MSVQNISLKEYMEALASGAAVPGGGTASAVAGAQGAMLAAMVARLTVGREKFAAYEAQCQAAIVSGENVAGQLLAAADADSEAFEAVMAAFRLPKGTAEEKARRKQAIADATRRATVTPFGVMQLALEGLQTARSLVGCSNPNAASDLAVSALSLLTCVRGAHFNVRINLPGLADAAEAERFRRDSEEIAAAARQLAEEICQASADCIG